MKEDEKLEKSIKVPRCVKKKNTVYVYETKDLTVTKQKKKKTTQEQEKKTSKFTPAGPSSSFPLFPLKRQDFFLHKTDQRHLSAVFY